MNLDFQIQKKSYWDQENKGRHDVKLEMYWKKQLFSLGMHFPSLASIRFLISLTRKLVRDIKSLMEARSGKCMPQEKKLYFFSQYINNHNGIISGAELTEF